MIVRTARPSATRRAAFTLMEVLVVVAIVVILASVGTIATLKFLEDAKDDQATQKMMNLSTAEKAWAVKNSGNTLQGDLSPLADFLEQKQGALIDPWGQQFQVEYIQTQNTTGGSDSRAIFYTTNPKSGKTLRFPDVSRGQ